MSRYNNGGPSSHETAASNTSTSHPDYTATSKLQYRPLYGERQQSAMEQWLSWCEDNGVVAPALIAYQWVRTNAPHKSFTNKSLGVMLKDDCIHIKDHSTGNACTFFDGSYSTCAEDRRDVQRVRQIAEQQRKTEQAKAAKLAVRLLDEAITAPVNGYFIDKGLTSTHGAKWHQSMSCWLVRVVDIDGRTINAQRIYNRPAPNKFFLKGGSTHGTMVVIGSPDSARRLLIAEGFATACTLHEETGETVIAALSSHNLKPVCELLHERYPSHELIVCGDDDHRSENNTGRISAEVAARAIGARVCYPTFCDGCTSCSDFNDAVQCEKRQLVML